MNKRQHAGGLAEVQQAYTALQRSERRLQAMFDQAAVGVALVDMETGRFERINQRYAQILGYRIEDLEGRDVNSLSDPDDAAVQVNQALRDELRQGGRAAFHIEKQQRRKDGSWVWIDLTVAPVVEAGGGRRYNMGVIQDITERRAMQEALRSSETRLRGILDHLPVGILLASPKRKLMFHNRNFTAITGYSAQDISDEGSWWLRAFPDPANRRKAMARWQELRAQAPRRGGLIERDEYDICRADGTFASIGISGILTENGEIVVFEDLSRYKAAQEQINYLAYYDSLTGLANHRLLVTRLIEAQRQSARSQQWGAVLMLGLDRFKTLNKARGHGSGDKLLRQVAQRLQASLRPTDTPARYGGDTFAIVLDASCPTQAQAATYADQQGRRFLLALRDTPFMLDEAQAYRASASIGAAIFLGQEETPESLLQQVDMAMYQAKACGRNTVVFYDAGLDEQVRMRAQLEADLQVAIDEQQLVPYFQAQVCCDRIVGAEVLVRWNHPQRGLVSPADFISIAEETGLILPLGAQVLRAACHQLARWQQDPKLSHLSLSVNISPLQFYQDDFVPQVLNLVADCKADPHLLGLELTESVLLQNIESTTLKMQQLKAHGIRFSLDDFGTGYSSLAYLKRLPLDQLKIDQSFVRDVLENAGDAALVRTIVGLGEAFGLQVLAEGVETLAQRDFLYAQGCPNWQGYLLSKPLPLDQFEAQVQTAENAQAFTVELHPHCLAKQGRS